MLQNSSDLTDQTSDSKQNDASVEKTRINKAFWLGLIGFLSTIGFAVVLSILAMNGFDSAEVVSGVVSPFLAVLGTLVGTFFGVQVGASGKEDLAKQARDASNKATAFAGIADSKDIQTAIDTFRTLSGQ